jgi:hypothetical protein
MACERYRDALTDVVAGEPASAAVETHLASCESCREELRALRQALAMADAELSGLLTAEPTPELVARIRQAVAETREPSPHDPAFLRQLATESELPAAWRFGWLWPATAAAATLLVALAVVLERGTPPALEPQVVVDAHRPQSAGNAGGAESSGAVVTSRPDRPAPGADRLGPVPQDSSRPSSRGASFESGEKGSAGVAAPPAPDSSPAPGSPAAVRRRIPAEPEVLVPPGETEALLRFVALVHREHLRPTSLAAAGQPSADLAELALIDIKPLEIVPLDPAELTGT